MWYHETIPKEGRLRFVNFIGTSELMLLILLYMYAV